MTIKLKQRKSSNFAILLPFAPYTKQVDNYRLFLCFTEVLTNIIIEILYELFYFVCGKY